MRRQCPRCGDLILVNRDGTLRRHKRFVSGGTYSMPGWVRCEGK